MLFYIIIMIKTMIENFDTLGHPKTSMGPPSPYFSTVMNFSLNDQPILNISTLYLVKQTFENFDILDHL